MPSHFLINLRYILDYQWGEKKNIGPQSRNHSFRHAIAPDVELISKAKLCLKLSIVACRFKKHSAGKYHLTLLTSLDQFSPNCGYSFSLL